MPQSTLPPMPPGWNLTLEDLSAQMHRGERPHVGWPEVGWAREYELSLLPEGTRFPRLGDVYSALTPYPTDLLLTWRSPVTTHVRFELPAGCRLRVQSDDADRPLAVSLLPEAYRQIEKAALPWWTRLRPDYGGYYVVASTLDLNTRFRLET